MRRAFCIILVLTVAIWFGKFSYATCHPKHTDGGILYAAEHGGKEHGGKEHGGKEHGGEEHGGEEHGGEEHGGVQVPQEPSADEIRQAMKSYVIGESTETGSFGIYDSETGEDRQLTLIRVHERVGKTGDYYYSCADFRDIDSGELLDLDLDVENRDGELSVVDVRIHKVNDKERYTYDEDDNKIPISE